MLRKLNLLKCRGRFERQLMTVRREFGSDCKDIPLLLTQRSRNSNINFAVYLLVSRTPVTADDLLPPMTG